MSSPFDQYHGAIRSLKYQSGMRMSPPHSDPLVVRWSKPSLNYLRISIRTITKQIGTPLDKDKSSDVLTPPFSVHSSNSKSSEHFDRNLTNTLPEPLSNPIYFLRKYAASKRKMREERREAK